MKFLRSFWRWHSEPQQPEPTEQVEPEPPQPLPPLEFIPDPPTEGAWLETETKDGQRLFLPLSRSPITLGTGADCDVVLTDRWQGVEKVQSQHVRIEQWKGTWVLVPLNRKAAVFVNQRRTGEYRLRNGVEVQLGEEGIRLVFRCVGSGSPTPPTASDPTPQTRE